MMGAGRQGYVLVCVLMFLKGFVDCEEQQFLSRQHASQFLLRNRRANSFLEEGKKGNLERECIEELCNKEEAREIFENLPETEYFYPKYLACLGDFRPEVLGRRISLDTEEPKDLRTCIKVSPV